ncbi:MAG: hypothetical protein E7578_03565 [Ruminococcaceae bacterium]|nr:hypothetical protein [Oscillospiraceae bacterium]
MKRLTGFILSGIIAAQTLFVGSVPSEGVSAYYELAPITGEESREVTNLYDGVTRTDIVLSNSSPYKKQAFTVVEFDPKQDDLYFEVRGGDPTYLTTKKRTSDTLARFNSEGTGKTALVATNGGLWMSINHHIRPVGNEASYEYPELEANVKKGYNIPWGYNMYDGEIVCTNNIKEETPFPDYFRQFGITSDGEAIFGRVLTHTTITNESTGLKLMSEGINRIPAKDALITYTDRGMASNYCLDDAYEVVIDCGYDYTVKPGCVVTGTVTAISPPGSTRSSMKSNRIILTARGDRLEDLKGFAVGQTVSINVEVEDTINPQNTPKWYNVSNCVNGHQWAIWDGVPQGIATTTYYPATILGVKADGRAVMITSYGRQYNSLGEYYSYGLQIGQVDELCQELGIVTCFLMDGGGSATMWCQEPDGSYELTGRPCDKKSDGTYGAERKVLSSLILAVGPSRSGIDSSDTSLSADNKNAIIREPYNVNCVAETDMCTVFATDFKNPSFKYDLFNSSADTYKYMVIEGSPTMRGGGEFTLGLYPTGGQTFDPVTATGKKISFDCNGTWQRRLVDLSSIPEWSGRMNYIRMDLFDDTGIGIPGEGMKLTRVKFFNDLASAEAFASGSFDPLKYGDADSSGNVNLSDVSLILKKIAKWNVSVSADADYDKNGNLNLSDAALILRSITVK